MAKIRKIVPSAPVSSFRRVAAEGGHSMLLLADAANMAYERMAPLAEKELEATGAEEGRRLAQQHIGQTHVLMAPGGNYRDAIAAVESDGSGGYSAVGPQTDKGRAYGRYQVMDFNIGPWTEKHYGTRLSKEEFLNNPAAQDAVFDGEFGSYVAKYGNPQDAASAWFSGRPMSAAGNASDGYNTVPEYVRKFNDALGVRMETPAVVVRDAEGHLKPRLYSPLSGPILQVHNAAAGIAYQSEVLEQSAVDLMAISNQFPLDPTGFREASTGYINQVVEAAPEQFRSDLRNALEKEATRRFMGVTEEHQRDVRQRASNSNRALMERQSTAYAEALAAGDEEAALEARADLEATLAARQSLPGVAWTPEQSTNVVMGAEREAEQLIAKNQKEVRDEYKGQLDTIIGAAEKGLTAADEGILTDPVVQALLPDLWREAAAKVEFRNRLPEFYQLTPGEQSAMAERMREQPIGEEWEADIIDAADKAAKTSRKAWEDDPIAQAGAVLNEKPAPLPPPTDGSFMNALAARRDYGNRLSESGYIDAPAYFSDAEAEMLSAALGEEVPPEARAGLAAAIASSFGSDAVRAFTELDVEPVLRFAGNMIAVGGDQRLAAEALRGQQMIAEGLVQVPDKASRVAAISGDITEALADLPESIRHQADLMEFAKAIYGARAQGVSPTSEESGAMMEAALQSALGQTTNRRGKTVGGVQDVLGSPTLLPVDVNGEDATGLIARSLGSEYRDGIFSSVLGHLKDFTFQDVPPEINVAAWEQAGGFPHLFGNPLTPKFVTDSLRIIPVSETKYRMEYSNTSIEDADGNILFFDLGVLLEEMR